MEVGHTWGPAGLLLPLLPSPWTIRAKVDDSLGKHQGASLPRPARGAHWEGVPVGRAGRCFACAWEPQFSPTLVGSSPLHRGEPWLAFTLSIGQFLIQ